MGRGGWDDAVEAGDAADDAGCKFGVDEEVVLDRVAGCEAALIGDGVGRVQCHRRRRG